MNIIAGAPTLIMLSSYLERRVPEKHSNRTDGASVPFAVGSIYHISLQYQNKWMRKK